MHDRVPGPTSARGSFPRPNWRSTVCSSSPSPSLPPTRSRRGPDQGSPTRGAGRRRGNLRRLSELLRRIDEEPLREAAPVGSSHRDHASRPRVGGFTLEARPSAAELADGQREAARRPGRSLASAAFNYRVVKKVPHRHRVHDPPFAQGPSRVVLNTVVLHPHHIGGVLVRSDTRRPRREPRSARSATGYGSWRHRPLLRLFSSRYEASRDEPCL